MTNRYWISRTDSITDMSLVQQGSTWASDVQKRLMQDATVSLTSTGCSSDGDAFFSAVVEADDEETAIAVVDIAFTRAVEGTTVPGESEAVQLDG